MKRITAILIMLLICSVAAAGCASNEGNSSSSSSGDSAVYEMDMEELGSAYPMDSKAELDYVEIAEEMGAYDEAEQLSGDGISELPANDRKLIKDVNMNVETKAFDEFTANIRGKIEALEGYIETSTMEGSSYEYTGGKRHAYIVARIPADHVSSFVSEVEAQGNVTSVNEYVQDVTEAYVDTESRKKTLEASQESLLELLKNADSVETIVALETRLTEIRYELESLEARLRSYDNQVAYSTVSINITEVERTTDTESQTMGEEMKRRLSDNLYGMKLAGRSFLIWLVGALPVLSVLAVISIVIGVIIRRGRRKKAGKEKTGDK